MRRTLRFLLLCAGVLGASFGVSAQWTQVGSVFDSGVTLNYTSRLAIAPDGTIYLACRNSSTFFLHRFDGNDWVQVSEDDGFPYLYFFEFQISRSGVPFVAADSALRLILLKYDGSSWQRVGDASRFSGRFTTLEPQLAFDSSDRPYAAIYRQQEVPRYDGTYWTDVGSKAAGMAYHELVTDSHGSVFAANGNDASVYRYVADTLWEKLSTAGISSRSATATVLAANAADCLHLGLSDHRDSISIYRLNGASWSRLGNIVPGGRMLNSTILFGASGMPYLLLYKRSSGTNGDFDLIRFDGTDWVNVDTTGLLNARRESPVICDKKGNIYVAVTNKNGTVVMKYNTQNDPVSVPETRPLSGITVAPNPVENNVTIRCANPSLLGKPAVVTDLQGRVIHRFMLAAQTRIQTTSWPAAVYQLQLPDGTSAKLVKQ